MTHLVILGMVLSWAAPSPPPGADERGPEVAELIRQLDSDDAGVRNNAASLLIGLGESAAPATARLAGLLANDLDADVRRHAAQALERIGPKARDATDALKNAARRDANPSVRVWAARGLARVSPDRADEAVDALIDGLKARGGLDRINAADGLRDLGPRARKAAPELERLARDDDAEVSRAARGALEEIGP